MFFCISYNNLPFTIIVFPFRQLMTNTRPQTVRFWQNLSGGIMKRKKTIRVRANEERKAGKWGRKTAPSPATPGTQGCEVCRGREESLSDRAQTSHTITPACVPHSQLMFSHTYIRTRVVCFYKINKKLLVFIAKKKKIYVYIYTRNCPRFF